MHQGKFLMNDVSHWMQEMHFFFTKLIVSFMETPLTQKLKRVWVNHTFSEHWTYIMFVQDLNEFFFCIVKRIFKGKRKTFIHRKNIVAI